MHQGPQDRHSLYHEPGYKKASVPACGSLAYTLTAAGPYMFQKRRACVFMAWLHHCGGMAARRSFPLLFVLPLLPCLAAAEAPTPLTQALRAGEISLMACLSPYGAQQDVADWPPGGFFHYQLYLPADYHENSAAKYPVMFITAPSGDAEMGPMAARLKRDRWVVVMLVEARNGSVLWQPNFVAAYDDVLRRVHVQPEMFFCTGFSGGARMCSTFPGMRPGFQGLILQAAGYWGPSKYVREASTPLAVYGIFGNTDPNRSEARRIRGSQPTATRTMIEVWEGDHAWAPTPVFERALDWVEDTVLLDGGYQERFTEAYRWYFSNKLALYEQSQSDLERYTLHQLLHSLPERWHLPLDTGTTAKLHAMDDAMSQLTESATLQQEIKARDAFREALLRDEQERGRNLLDMATLYEEITERYPNTIYSQRAAIRKQSVRWEAQGR